MFQISVEREFCAAHALAFRGGGGGVPGREPLHGHNFRLTITVEGDRLDADGLLVDFHALERLVDEIIRPWNNANLNESPAFASPQSNPSAEAIARHIAERISAGLPAIAAPGASPLRLASARITEAPGCAATYFPPPSPQR